ncbi:MAG: S41 family peptidase, partial [Planctomycetota bacterium]|nr:S41 family peptidase [Planctomycetota bacterium]
RIRQFLDTTPQELLDAIQAAKNAVPIKGLVLDLRENPGGSLPAAITIANMFLEAGTIVSVSGRRTESRSWDAQPDTMLSNVPMLVLVNNTSASASEIVSGSLQANGRAAVLGMRTFGKGSVQEVMKLASGGMLKFTTARYDLSNGRTIDKRLSEDSGLWGVDPNSGLVIRETREETLERIRSREPYIVITQDEPETFQCGDRTWIQEVLNDVQLAEGLLAMQSYLNSGEWPTLSDDDPVLAGVTEEMTVLAKERIEILKSLVDIDKQLTSLQGEVVEEIVIPDAVNDDHTTITLTDEDGIIIGSWEVSRGDVKGALQSLHLIQSSQE